MASKICALIRQTWYETAKKNLPPADRLRFYEMCLEFEFFGNLPEDDAPFGARLLFDMVQDDLESDKKRAAERSERNRRNGLSGGRPKVTEVNTESENPQKPTGFFGKPIYNNNKQNNTEQNNVTEVTENEDTHMFFAVCLDFFERGCKDPTEEGRKFWNYYTSLGWKTKSGGEIVDRLALAKAWRLSDCSRNAIRSRAPYADLMHKANPVEIQLLADFVAIERLKESRRVVITFEHKETAILLDYRYMAALQTWIPTDEKGRYNLEYKATQTTLN